MNEVLRIGKAASEMHITVQGYKVTLCFADKANPEVAAFVKQALLGAYSMSNVLQIKRFRQKLFHQKTMKG